MRPDRIPRRRWGADQFAAFWMAPRLDLPTDELAEDVRGWWPGQPAPRVGIAAYTRPLRILLGMVPDFRLDIAESAEHGDFTFVRWNARGTWRGERLDFSGIDRIRQRDGRVAENRIYCTHPLIDAVLAADGARRD